MVDVVDLHTHTIASGHAYNTIYEMADSAAKKGVAILGIADHAPAMEGSASKHYFRASRRIPKTLYGVQLLFGAELNILNYRGSVDLDEEYCAPLDFAVASLHIECITPGTVEENTNAMLGAMKNPKVFIIGHPDDGTFPIDFEQLVSSAVMNCVLIELNEASVRPNSYRINAYQNACELLKVCRKHGARVIVSSDAHIETEILQHTYAYQLLDKVGFPEELVVNTSAKTVIDCLEARRQFCTNHRTGSF